MANWQHCLASPLVKPTGKQTERETM